MAGKAIIIMRKMMKKLGNHWIYIILIIIFTFFGMWALLHPGLFTAHDIWHQVVRLYYYSQAVNDGQFPPYWIGQLANGFGYPLFFFSYHLPWLIAIPFIKIGVDIPNTIKILFFLSYLLSGLFMYFFVDNLLKNRMAALLSSILYLWAPYHFLTIFVGASMGIVWVFAFLPLLLLGIHLIKEENTLGIPITAIGLAGIILSHLMHLIFLIPVLLSFLLAEFATSRNKIILIRRSIFGLVIGCLLSAFYLIPSVYYNQFTRLSQESGLVELYKRNFVNFSQLLYSKWGFGPITSNAKDGEISLQIGIAQWISVVGVTLLLFLGKLRKDTRLLTIFTLSGFVISIFLMLDYSSPVWQFIEKFVALDYPFRELLGVTFIGSFFAGILFVSFKGKKQYLILIPIILIAVYTNRNHIRVNLYTEIPLQTYVDSEVTTNTFNEYLPINADNKLLNRGYNLIEGGNFSTSNFKRTTNSLSLDINAKEEGVASIGQFYFPGQTVYLDSKIIKFSADTEGRISFPVIAGVHSVTVKYQETPLIKISIFMTVIGIFITGVLLLKKKVLL